jgi:hypothetical protein
MFKRAQLLACVRPFERCRFERGEYQQGTPVIRVNADMTIQRGQPPRGSRA